MEERDLFGHPVVPKVVQECSGCGDKPKPEEEFNAHYRCTYCHAIKTKRTTVFWQGMPFCKGTECLAKYS